MPNRDYEDSPYNRNEGRFEGRDRDDWRDQSNRGSRDWDRRGDDFRQERGREASGQGRDDYSNRQYGSDYGSRGSERGFAQYGQYGQRPEQQRSGGGDEGRNWGEQSGRNWFDERQDAQRFDRNFNSGGGYQGSQSGRDWGHSPSYNYQRPDYSRSQSNYGSRDWSASQPYGGQQTSRSISAWDDRGDRGEWGRGRDDENWGQQLRQGVHQMANRVKRAFRGPKGYKRSDERIREDVNDRLAHQDELDPSDIEVAVANGEVTLTGTVQSRREKFLAEEIADDVGGVNDVHNQLRVRREDVRDTSTTSTTTTTNLNDPTRNRNARA